MLGTWQHRAGIAVTVAGTQVASAFGTGTTVAAAYVLAALLGVVLVAQGERRSVSGTVSGNAIVGFAAGTTGCVLLVTSLLVALLDAPWDLALWRALLQTWGAWAGVGAVALSTFFVAGLATSIR